MLVDFHLVGEAAPKLLKSIEEPPPTTVFVVLAEEVTPELVTIASRCVRVDFAAVPQQVLVDRLVADGVDPELGGCGGSGGRWQPVAAPDCWRATPGTASRRAAWYAAADAPGRHRCDRMRGGRRAAGSIDGVLEPLAAQHAEEMARFLAGFEAAGIEPRKGDLKRLEDRHKREQRRVRVDELRSGLATLVGRYRDGWRPVDRTTTSWSPPTRCRSCATGSRSTRTRGCSCGRCMVRAAVAGRSSLSRHTPVVRPSPSCGGLRSRAGPAGADDVGQVRCPAADITARIGVVAARCPSRSPRSCAWRRDGGAVGRRRVGDRRRLAHGRALREPGPGRPRARRAGRGDRHSVVAGVVAAGRRSRTVSASCAPDTSPLDPERLDLVAHDDRLNPGAEDFAHDGATAHHEPAGQRRAEGPVVLDRWLHEDRHGRRAESPACSSGRRAALHVRSARSIADGAWHEVRCVRTSDEVVLSVDGVVVDRRPRRDRAWWPTPGPSRSRASPAATRHRSAATTSRATSTGCCSSAAVSWWRRRPHRCPPRPCRPPRPSDHRRRPTDDGAPGHDHHDAVDPTTTTTAGSPEVVK